MQVIPPHGKQYRLTLELCPDSYIQLNSGGLLEQQAGRGRHLGYSRTTRVLDQSYFSGGSFRYMP
jgi:hypothetical protein